MTNAFPSHLTDDALVAAVKRLAGCERATTAQLVAHLAVMDERQLHLKAGFKSLFVYCLETLRLSEDAICNRLEVARAARKFPIILDRFADGSVTLTAVRLLAPHLTAENHEALLREATHKRTEQVKELVARISPRPDVASSIRKLPAPRSAMVPAAPAAGAGPIAAPSEHVALQPVPPARPATVAPLAPDRYEFRFTAPAATRDKLRHAQDLLRHALPGGDTGEIIDRALTVLIESLERRKFAATEKPRAARATVENIALRCAAHNRYEAEVYFGPIWAARGEGRVEEASPRYGLSVRPSTRFETSCVSDTQ